MALKKRHVVQWEWKETLVLQSGRSRKVFLRLWHTDRSGGGRRSNTPSKRNSMGTVLVAGERMQIWRAGRRAVVGADGGGVGASNGAPQPKIKKKPKRDFEQKMGMEAVWLDLYFDKLTLATWWRIKKLERGSKWLLIVQVEDYDNGPSISGDNNRKKSTG